MWNPNSEGLKKLINLFQDSFSTDNNKKHREIYEEITEYSKNKEICNYFVYIFNDETVEVKIRQVAGLTLKNTFEREFNSIPEVNIEFFKENILKHYFHENSVIRKTISIIINTFIQQGGLDLWHEILEFLFNNLDNKLASDNSIETLNLIFEDTGNLMEEKYPKFVRKYMDKLINSLRNSSFLTEENLNILILALTSIEIIIENCKNIVNELLSQITQLLINLHMIKNVMIRSKVSRCWMALFRIKNEIMKENFLNLLDFFLISLSFDYYELNFISAEFFLIMTEESNSFYFQETTYNQPFKSVLEKLIPSLLNFSKLTENDLCFIENRFKKESNDKKSTFYDSQEDTENYNENYREDYSSMTTLRKVSAKILDKLSFIYPLEIYNILKNYLENDIKHNDWIIRERSILILGAISEGSYEYLKPNLSNLIPFLIFDLQNENKFIRAISCWSLSRFTKFILIDNLNENANELYKNFLAEILKRVMDTDPLVQISACSTFSNMITIKKEMIEPFLDDVFQIFNHMVDKCKHENLIVLFDLITYTCEEYPEYYKTKEYSQSLVQTIVKKWTDTQINDYESILIVSDVFISIVKVSGFINNENYTEFGNRALLIIRGQIETFKKNSDDIKMIDKDLIGRCLDLISILCEKNHQKIHILFEKSDLIENVVFLLNINDLEIKEYAIIFIGEISKSESKILLNNSFDNIMQALINYIECPSSINKYNHEDILNLHICNNVCWTLGIMVISFQDKILNYAQTIMSKLLKIFCVPRLNKSLAQNLSICIGRLSLVFPNIVSKNLDYFLKQFCISLRLTNHTIEKQQAFSGLCQSIIINPNGVINHFAYLCDAICNYENPPLELESVFQNIIFSYKSSLNEKWNSYFHNFPQKLQTKMLNRFSLQ